MEGGSPQEKPRRRRRWGVRALVFLALAPLLLLVVVALLLTFLPSILTEERAKDELVSALTSALGLPVRVESLRYHPFRGVELFGLVIGPPPGYREDLLRARRVAVRYRLGQILSRRLVLEEAAVDDPLFTQETLGGKTNLAAWTERLGRGAPEPAAPAPPAEPLRGPLSPLTVVIQEVAVRRLAVRVVGEGPAASLSGLSLGLRGLVDPAHVEAALALAGPAELSLSLPAAEGPPLELTGRLSLSSSTALEAGSADGLSVRRVEHRLALGLAGEAAVGGRPLPPFMLRAAVGLAARPGEDRLALEGLELDLDRQPLARIKGEVRGLQALLADLIGGPGAAALSAQLGLPARRDRGTLALQIDRIGVPLDALDPYLRVLRPGLAVGGELALKESRVEGTLPELIQGTPAALALRIELDGVALRSAAPPLAVAPIQGSLRLSRVGPDDPEQGPFALAGALELRRVEQAAARVGRVGLVLDGSLERLAYPVPGALALGLAVDASELTVPGVRVADLRLAARLTGRDVLTPGRGPDPLLVRAELGISSAVVASATPALALEGLRLELTARPRALLEPNPEPIPLELSLALSRFEQEGVLALAGLSVALGARLTDPRLGVPLDVAGKLGLGLEQARAPQGGAGAARLALDFAVHGLTPRVLPGRAGPPAMLPASVKAALSLALTEASYRHPELGSLPVSAELESKLELDLPRQQAVVSGLRLRVNRALSLLVNARASRIFAPGPSFKLDLELPRFDLGELVASLPASLRERAPGLTASGKAQLALRAAGQVPVGPARLDLERPPVEGQLTVGLEEVGVALPAQALALDGFGGDLDLTIGPGRTELSTRLGLARLERGAGAERLALGQARAQFRAGLLGDSWRISAEAEAARLQAGARSAEALAGARLALEAVHPIRGDVELRRLEVLAPGAGLELAVAGRLSRRSYGVLRPDLQIRGRFDLDRLRGLLPELGEAAGTAELAVSLATLRETELLAGGELALDRLRFVRPGSVEVVGARGRLPLSQRLYLRPAALDEAVAQAEGVLGDDLEARLRELAGELAQARLALDTEDILLVSPKSADYDALRPYYEKKSSRLAVERLVLKGTPLSDLMLEGSWSSGVLRLDRFAFRVWEGDVVGDLALQVLPNLDVRLRLRSTLTNLNMDVPYAQARRIAPVRDPAEQAQYRVSGTADLKFSLRERLVTANFDLHRLYRPSIVRLMEALDPEQKKSGIQKSLAYVKNSDRFGLRPKGARIWITQNLMKLNVDWQRLTYEVSFGDEWWWDLGAYGLRALAIIFAAPPVIDAVNNTLGDSFSIGNDLDSQLDRLRLEDSLAPYASRLAPLRAEVASASGE